jgi:hypothetical protein
MTNFSKQFLKQLETVKMLDYKYLQVKRNCELRHGSLG